MLKFLQQVLKDNLKDGNLVYIINFAAISLAIVVKWLLNSLAMMAGSAMSLPFT